MIPPDDHQFHSQATSQITHASHYSTTESYVFNYENIALWYKGGIRRLMNEGRIIILFVIGHFIVLHQLPKLFSIGNTRIILHQLLQLFFLGNMRIPSLFLQLVLEEDDHLQQLAFRKFCSFCSCYLAIFQTISLFTASILYYTIIHIIYRYTGDSDFFLASNCTSFMPLMFYQCIASLRLLHIIFSLQPKKY